MGAAAAPGADRPYLSARGHRTVKTVELVGHRAIGEHQELRRERRHAARLARGVLVRRVLGGEVAQRLRRGGRRLTADMEHGDQPWNPTRLADGIPVGVV